MTQSQGDDLFDEPADDYGQDGPDLFGMASDEVFEPHDRGSQQTIEVDIDEDEMDEIPIDPTDEPENQVTPAEMEQVQASGPGRELTDEDAPAPASTPRVEPSPRTEVLTPDPERDAPLALYRRYRPDTFAEVIGQTHVTEPLQRALAHNRVNHAYLFSGPRGCGKTTSARILARCLNCEQGPTPTPCGVCPSCRDLARGGPGSIDVIEIDAASHGGVNEARDLRERAFFAPVNSRYKIYIIDEAHMVTKEGFNALLKLVEEPPPHVKFIFATTEPEKVLGTIRSRTHHYPFRLVPAKTLSNYLQQLCDAEGVHVDAAALPLVVRAGAGSVRDSLSVLDQLLGGAEDGGVTYEQATSLLGYTPDSLLDEIVDAFAAGDAQGVFACIDKVIEVGQDPRRFAEDLLRRLRDLIIVAAVPDALTSGLVEVAGDQADRLAVQAQGLGTGELTRAAEVIAQGLTDMRGTTAPRLYLELMCSRVLLPGADADGRGIHARLDRLERRLNMVGSEAGEPGVVAPGVVQDAPASGAAAAREAARAARTDVAPAQVSTAQPDMVSPVMRDRQSAPVQRPAPPRPSNAEPTGALPRTPEASPAGPPAGQGARPGSDPQPEAGSRPEAAPQQAAPAASVPTASPRAAGQPDTAGLRALWPQVLDAVKRRRRVTWIVLSQNAQVASLADGVLTLSMKSAGARESFGRGGSPDVLGESIIEVVGIAPEIVTVVGEGDPVPPSIPARPGAGPAASGVEASRAMTARDETASPGAPSPRAQQPDDARRAQPSVPATSDPQTVTAPSFADPAAQQVAQERRAPGGRPAPLESHDDEPPPDDDDYDRPNFAELARANLHRPTSEVASPPAEQSRDDVDLTDAANVDDLLRRELGAELIADDTAS